MDGARVDTAQVLASQVGWTVVIGGTLCALTQHLRVTEVAGIALAVGAMVVATAFCVQSATVVQDARTDTLVVETGVGVRTISVRFTFNCY